MQHRLSTTWRWLKYKYLLLMRAEGGASMVAMGFAIGMAIEMFTLPTFGLAFFLIFPLVKLLRGNLPAALIGFVSGKLIYILMSFPNAKVGSWILPDPIHLFEHEWANKLLLKDLRLTVGGMIVGALLGVLCYYPVKFSVNAFKSKRKEKRRASRVRWESGSSSHC
ncbi:DUF2062 domain-containing protein [Cohnella panacarvi]|uniref:DUF2062 domain-containing protein n=1 Tax=Cohnella panacarvi TaxID=400776 RepID=UPI00047C365C|nr:DUF2062 domain-containing protein [Cohnella panacarvi]